MKKIIFLLVLLVSFLSISGVAQTSNGLTNVITSDSLASGNYKNILTSFYQLAFSNLTGPNKAFSFNSNPFAIMLKNNPALSVDTNYYKYRALRKLNIGFNINLDSSFRFNGFASTIRYALINRRDETVSRSFIIQSIRNDSEYTKLNHLMVQYEDSAFKNNITRKILFNRQINSLFNDSTVAFNKMDSSFQTIVLNLAIKNNLSKIIKILKSDPSVVLSKYEQSSFNDLKNSFQNKHLLTVAVSDTTYNDGFFFKTLQFSAESVKGFLNPNRAANLEWDIKANYVAGNDSLLISRNLHRQVFSFEPGLNLVIKNKSSQKSFFEFKFSGSYNHIFNGLYPGEQQNNLMFNGTLSLRVYNDTWIPLQFKYDTKSGNVFGFLNIATNFTGLKSLLLAK